MGNISTAVAAVTVGLFKAGVVTGEGVDMTDLGKVLKSSSTGEEEGIIGVGGGGVSITTLSVLSFA
ncbi:hypothetical protein BD770DRAFT_403364 [Pilaira anomala]|nr:hypothetical protein BD770DRAFT_403364 [Pilaira anomala]